MSTTASDTTASDTTVWDLAAATGQPLEVVIFQAVGYGGWTEGGIISAEWAASITGVLHGGQPWKRRTHLKSAGVEPTEPSADTSAAIEASDMDPVRAFAAKVVANLGSTVEVNDSDPASVLVSLSLGEMRGDGFSGYPDEAPVWAQLAAGELSVADLENR